MKLELSPTHPMHKGLCRGHGGSVWWVWLIGYVGVHRFVHTFVHTCAGVNGGVKSLRMRTYPSIQHHT